MNHRNRVLGAAALCVAALAVRGSAAPATSTLAPALANPVGLEFTLKLPPGKTSFMQGETIPVTLAFSNTGPQRLWLSQFYGLKSFEVEPKEGVTNLWGDVPRSPVININGFVPPPIRLSEKPTEERCSVNEYLRFDRPGTYTIRATTSSVFVLPEGAAPPQISLFPSDKPFISTSKPISIQIVPADPQWQAEQVEVWRAFWAQQKPDADGYGWASPQGVLPPANDLRFLNTRAAAQAMIDRLGQDIAPRSSGSEAYFWRLGLTGFSDRAWLIEAMKSAMARPDYAITQGFLDNLDALQGLQSDAPQKPAAFSSQPSDAQLAHWNLAFAALGPKKGRARAMTVHSLLESAWGSNLNKVPGVQQQLPGLVQMVPDVFNDLPRLPQQYLLAIYGHSDEWTRIKSPRMAAPLRRLWDATRDEPNDGGRYFPNAILHRLYEVDPETGRALILKEMAAPHPRVSFEVLALLPDKRLPLLQNLWLAHLNQDGEDQDVAAQLIGRYATEAIKAQVKAEYVQLQRNKMLSSSMNQGLSRYLARVKQG